MMEKFTLDKLPPRVLKKIDLETAFKASRLVIAAERLQLFRMLHGRRLLEDEIGKNLKIHRRYIAVFLDALVSMGLLVKKGNVYGNSPLAEKYFVKERPIYWTRQFSRECSRAYDAYCSLEKVLLSGDISHAIRSAKKKNYLEAMRDDAGEAEDFTQMLFYYHQSEAEALAAYLDLEKMNRILDAGGGSGVMSIALLKRNPKLAASILDIEPVCRIAKKNIRSAGMSDRMDVIPGDFHKGMPEGYDVIMLCDIGKVSEDLLKEAYRRLPSSGMILLVDRFLSNDRTEPLDRLLSQFEGSSFGMETGEEMVELVKKSGFVEVRIKRLINDTWVITARKPPLMHSSHA